MTEEYFEAFQRALKSVIVMPQCQVCLVLVTPSYLKDYFSGTPDIVTQVRLSKQLNQPVILMLDKDLTPRERKQVERIFEDHNVVAKIMFDRDNIEQCKGELFEALKPYGANRK